MRGRLIAYLEQSYYINDACVRDVVTLQREHVDAPSNIVYQYCPYQLRDIGVIQPDISRAMHGDIRGVGGFDQLKQAGDRDHSEGLIAVCSREVSIGEIVNVHDVGHYYQDQKK
jgi:hypothetical protein